MDEAIRTHIKANLFPPAGNRALDIDPDCRSTGSPIEETYRVREPSQLPHLPHNRGVSALEGEGVEL